MIDPETMSILVVDDMKSMRLTIRKMLQDLKIGGMLRFAGDGKEGLATLADINCDMAIIDWNMPVMNGITMLEKIRQDKALRDMPVIMITAEAERDIVSEVAETEIDAYLLKPLTLAALDRKVRSVVDRANNPDPATQHRLKARTLEEQGKFDAAIQEIRIALTHRPGASRLLRQMGLLHFKINKPNIAEKCLLKAASINRQDTRTRAHLAKYYEASGQLEKAGNYYLEMLSLSDRYFDDAIAHAEKLLEKGNRHLSAAIFSKVITRSRRSNSSREAIIEICLNHGEYEYPKNLLMEYLQANPANYDMMFKLGLIYLETREPELALERFLNVDRHVRGHIDAKLEIARLYVRYQKILKADEYLNQILRLDPAHEKALALRRQI